MKGFIMFAKKIDTIMSQFFLIVYSTFCCWGIPDLRGLVLDNGTT